MKNSIFCLLLGIILGFIQLSCTEEEKESGVTYQLLTTTPATALHPGNTLQLKVTPATSGWSFSSKNSNIASVSDSGLVTMNYIGATMVYVHNEAGHFVDSVQITVSPRLIFFADPFIKFYASEQEVSNFENAQIKNRYWDAKHEGAYNIVFFRKLNDQNDQSTDYHFNSCGEMDYAEVALLANSAFDTKEHLLERYPYLGRKKYDIIVAETLYNYTDHHFISTDSSTLICMTYEKYSYAFRVEYRPYSTQSMEAILNDSVQKVFDRTYKNWKP